MLEQRQNQKYQVRARCCNCGWTGDLQVQKRQPLKEELCPDCECHGLGLYEGLI